MTHRGKNQNSPKSDVVTRSSSSAICNRVADICDESFQRHRKGSRRAAAMIALMSPQQETLPLPEPSQAPEMDMIRNFWRAIEDVTRVAFAPSIPYLRDSSSK